MKTPPFLKQGDTIGITATARAVSFSEIANVSGLVESYGFQLQYSQSIHRKHHIFAGTAAERAKDFNEMIYDDAIKAIWCARGGYGSVQMFELIDWEFLQNHPKWIIGFSDVTVLLCAAMTNGVQSIHATMPYYWRTNGSVQKGSEALMQLLAGHSTPLSVMPNNPTGGNYSIKGQLVAGNMAVLASLAGSPYFPDLTDKILLLEDIDEYLYQVERMLYTLHFQPGFSQLKALVIGDFTSMKDNAEPFGKDMEAIFSSVCEKHGIPFFKDAKIGHSANNYPLVLGADAEIFGENGAFGLLQNFSNTPNPNKA